ncbi:MAG: alpha/beta fold hydrolase [Candidatus Rokubacteria bacterium]|nr:alpha/beta fold hydrolase [Candidatus Rokubacteria bacterium]
MPSAASTVTPFVDDSAGDPPVRGFLHRSANPSGDALVLAHGAGSNADSPILVAVANAFAATGIHVLRCDLPYRQARHTGPPPPGSAQRDRAGLGHAALVMRPLGAGRLFLGGHSYGGRQASILAAEDPAIAAALLLLAYPLHPPRRAGELRTAHFPRLRTPALFVHGSRDPFGSLEELRSALALIPAPTALRAVEGAAHDLMSRRARSGADVALETVSAFLELVGA